tara:strand:+ start:1082 stop:1357 length:276 start_codon:yes stop_codon:yes gene_type:complete
MPKLVWENNRQVPPAKNTKSHSRHYVPSGKDSFDQTYKHILSIGAFQMQEFCRDKRNERRIRAVENLRRITAARRRARDGVNSVVPFDNQD